MAEIAEIWELVKEKVMFGLFACLILFAVILAGAAIWRLVVYYQTQSRVRSAKRIYNTIKLGETKERAVLLFRGYAGGKDQYLEEALLEGGRHEEVIFLLFNFGHGESGEIRLTYVADKLVRKQQSGIW